jgi:hypothetical protein
MVLDFFIVSRRPERLPKAIQAQDLQRVNKWKNLAWYRSERRALLGLEQSSPTEPSNARRSVCAANDATPKILTVVQFEMTGARTVPVRSGWRPRSLENSPVALVVERAADGDRPRSGQANSLPNSQQHPRSLAAILISFCFDERGQMRSVMAASWLPANKKRP